MRIGVRGLLVLSVVAPLGLPAEAQADRAEILASVTAFAAAMKAKDTAAIRGQFDASTRFTFVRQGPQGVRVDVMSGDAFLALIGDPARPALDERLWNPVVQQDGDLATVWADYRVDIGGTFSHCGNDALDLVRVGGTWRIINWIDTARRTGCEGGP